MKSRLVWLYVIVISLLFGCQQNASEDLKPRTQQPLGITDLTNKKDAEDIAEHLVHLAERVPDVKNATAIVIGDLVVVGIDVNAKLDRSDVGVVKYGVAEALSNDPHGAYAFISADPDINVRLKEMRKEMNAGHPITGIMNELAGIVGRIIPVVPGPEHKKSNPEPTKANDAKLSKDKEKQLKNVQEKQGKKNIAE